MILREGAPPRRVSRPVLGAERIAAERRPEGRVEAPPTAAAAGPRSRWGPARLPDRPCF